MPKSCPPRRFSEYFRRRWPAISRFMARFARRQQGTGRTIVVWQICYPVQHVLDAAACMASSATFRGILLWAVSRCCYNNGGLRNRHCVKDIEYQ